MDQKTLGGTPLATVAPRNVISSAARDILDYTDTLTEIQRRYLITRFGLSTDRARLAAQLAWGCR